MNPFDYEAWNNLKRNIVLHLKNGDIDKGVFLGADHGFDNGEGDSFILDVDGDTTVGRLILAKDVERVEFED